jgi:hypothetical protein
VGFRARLDDHEIHISSGRRVDATGMSAQAPLCREVDIARTGRARHYQSQRGRQPLDAGSIVIARPQSLFQAIARDEHFDQKFF